MRLLDPRFKYVPSSATDITATWRKFGFKPTTESERRARLRKEAPGAELAPPRAHRRARPTLKLAVGE